MTKQSHLHPGQEAQDLTGRVCPHTCQEAQDKTLLTPQWFGLVSLSPPLSGSSRQNSPIPTLVRNTPAPAVVWLVEFIPTLVRKLMTKESHPHPGQKAQDTVPTQQWFVLVSLMKIIETVTDFFT